MIRTAIFGTGRFIPGKVVTNHDLAKIMPTSDDWIQQRTGIVERHFVDWENDPTDGSEMGARAAKNAMEMAGVKASEIDLVIWGTLSPDHCFPGNACVGQERLGVNPGTPGLDIRNQCSSFIYGLSVADAMIRTGAYRRVLLIGSEIHSTALEFNERGRDVAVLFGDGAGAVVLGPSPDDKQGILATDIHADGKHALDLTVLWGSKTHPVYLTAEQLENGYVFPHMNGKLVFKNAVVKMPETIRTVLQKTSLTPADLDLFIPHQANLRIAEYVQKVLELPDEKVYNNIQKYGNTTAASIPIALDECVRSGKLKRGQLLCVAAFGAGFTWGSALIRF